MRKLLALAAIIVAAGSAWADDILLVYEPGNTLFEESAGKTITSSTQCVDPQIRRLLSKYDMTWGCRIGSDIIDILDGYYAFVLDDGKGEEAADSLTALSYVRIAAPNGSIHPLGGATRDPTDQWYNQSFRWEVGHHHEGCDDSTYFPDPHFPHYRQWYLPRGGYDRAWAVTTGNANNIIAIIDSSFEVDQPDLAPNWAWDVSEQGGTPGYDDDGDGYIDNVLGWDFGDYVPPPYPESDPINPGDPDVGHELRWWELQGFDHPWEIPCSEADCVCDSTTSYCHETKTKSAWGSARHGTTMASIFGAHASETPGEIGMAGINWDTRIMPIKIGNQTEEEMDVPNSLHVAMAKALEYVGLRKQMGDNIIALNMSLTFDGRGRLEDNIRLQ